MKYGNKGIILSCVCHNDCHRLVVYKDDIFDGISMNLKLIPHRRSVDRKIGEYDSVFRLRIQFTWFIDWLTRVKHAIFNEPMWDTVKTDLDKKETKKLMRFLEKDVIGQR